MNRRDFVKTLGVAAAAGMAGASLRSNPAEPAPAVVKRRDPRPRGFNLTEMTGANPSRPEFRESDFALMAEWGFNFARLPLTYWIWSKPDAAAWQQIDEREFDRLDRAIELGKRYGVHVNLCLHRIPGYCINGREKEPHDLFKGDAGGQTLALEAATHHWEYLTRRYRGRPSSELSFDLLNEPPFGETEAYVRVVRHLVRAIRAIDPARKIVADGADIGNTPIYDLADLGIAQSTRGYEPKPVSHYGASWVPAAEWAPWPDTTSWPITAKDGTVWNKETLRTKMIEPWRKLQAMGVEVHVGEWGAFTKTPHAVVLAWMQDYLELWQEAGWGWSMWNLRGAFGVLESERPDVNYESFRGMKLDRRMLELLLAH